MDYVDHHCLKSGIGGTGQPPALLSYVKVYQALKLLKTFL